MRSRRPSDRRAGGYSLTGTLVALGIAAFATAGAIEGLLRTQLDAQRLVGGNDLALNAAGLQFELERELRNAGSGFAAGSSAMLGCLLRAARGGTQILPSTAALPAPFASVSQSIRLAPVLVFAGAGTGGSDVIAVVSGAAGIGDLGMTVQSGGVSATEVRVDTALGLRPNDLVLLAEDGVGCMLQQVASTFVPTTGQAVAIGGTYAAPTIDGLPIGFFSAGAAPTQLVPLGGAAAARPRLRLLGLGANGIMFGYDLLRLDGATTSQPLASNVVELRVRYGADTDADGLVDGWFSPAAAGWTAAELGAGTAAANAQLRRILAVRVAAVLRSERPQAQDVAPAQLDLFADLDATLRVSYAVPAAMRRYRHRLVDFTVPMRNLRYAGT